MTNSFMKTNSCSHISKFYNLLCIIKRFLFTLRIFMMNHTIQNRIRVYVIYKKKGGLGSSAASLTEFSCAAHICISCSFEAYEQLKSP